MLGAGKKQEASEMASTGFAIAVILGLTVVILGNVFVEDLAVWIGAVPETMDDTIAYMRIDRKSVV